MSDVRRSNLLRNIPPVSFPLLHPIHLTGLMLNTIRQDGLEVKKILRELKEAKLYASNSKGSSYKGSSNKEITNILLVVAVLIITVTFSAGFSPPGGYSEQSGTPNLVEHEVFRYFVSFNSAALAYGIASALILILGIFLEEFAAITFHWGGI